MVPLDTLELCGYTPTDDPKMTLQIKVGDRRVSASITTKSLKKVLAVIRESGPNACFASLQGKLVGEEILDCGLVCQVKAKQAPAQIALHLGH